MAVDDVAVGAVQVEGVEHALAHGGVVVQPVIGVFGLHVGGFVGDEAPLEGGHPVPAEDGAVAPAPQPPQKVHAELPLRGAGLVVVGSAGGGVGVVQEGPARQIFAADGGEAHEGAVLVHGDAAVEEQVAVVDPVQAALGVEEADVALELLAVAEGAGEGVDERVFLRGEGAGVLGVHGGEVGVQQGVDLPADGHGFVLEVHLVQQQPVVHAEAGITADFLPL